MMRRCAVRPPLREMVVIDCLYVEQWSLWTDFKILVRTVPVVLADITAALR